MHKLTCTCSAALNKSLSPWPEPLQVTCYEQVGGRQRLAVLEALLAAVADMEAVRGHMLAAATAAQERHEQGQAGPDNHTGLLGSDADGSRYYLLAGDVGRVPDSSMHLLPTPMCAWSHCADTWSFELGP